MMTSFSKFHVSNCQGISRLTPLLPGDLTAKLSWIHNADHSERVWIIWKERVRDRVREITWRDIIVLSCCHTERDHLTGYHCAELLPHQVVTTQLCHLKTCHSPSCRTFISTADSVIAFAVGSDTERTFFGMICLMLGLNWTVMLCCVARDLEVLFCMIWNGNIVLTRTKGQRWCAWCDCGCVMLDVSVVHAVLCTQADCMESPAQT